MKRSAELPPLSAELVLIGTWLQVQREERGERWCFTKGVGQMRRTLATSGVMLPTRAAREVLKGLCGLCPHKKCPMKTWSIIAATGASRGKWAKTKTAKT